LVTEVSVARDGSVSLMDWLAAGFNLDFAASQGAARLSLQLGPRIRNTITAFPAKALAETLKETSI
jgi:hypothetical protein